MKREISKKIFYILFIFLSILVFFIRLWPIKISFFWDESVYLQHAEYFYSGKNNYNEFNTRPVFLSMIFAFFYNFYHDIVTPKVIIALFGFFGFIFVFLIGKELYNEKIGFLSSLFFGFSSYIVNFSKDILTEIPSMTFFLISFYFCILSLKNNKKENNILLFFSGVFFGLSFLTRFIAIILIFIILLFILFNRNLNFKKIDILKFSKIILVYLIGIFITILPYLIWIYLKTNSFFNVFINANKVVSDFNEPFYFYLQNFFVIFPIIISLSFILYMSYFIFTLFKKIKTNEKDIINKENIINKDIIFILWIGIYLIYISLVPHKEIRYIIPLFLPVYFLSAKGLVLIESFFIKFNKKIGDFFTILFIMIFFVFSKNSFDSLNQPFNTYESEELIISDFLENYSQSNNKENYVIYSRYNHPVYGYYTNLLVYPIYNKEFYKYYKRYMQENGFFIYYKNLGDNKEDWLENNSEFKKIFEINNINVYEYKVS